MGYTILAPTPFTHCTSTKARSCGMRTSCLVQEASMRSSSCIWRCLVVWRVAGLMQLMHMWSAAVSGRAREFGDLYCQLPKKMHNDDYPHWAEVYSVRHIKPIHFMCFVINRTLIFTSVHKRTLPFWRFQHKLSSRGNHLASYPGSPSFAQLLRKTFDPTDNCRGSKVIRNSCAKEGEPGDKARNHQAHQLSPLSWL